MNQLKQRTRRAKPKRIGRGGKRGTYSGRGIKGQKARAGRKLRPEMRDIIKKLPKRRGYRFKPIVAKKPLAINVSLLEKFFDNGAEISPKILKEAGLIEARGKKIPKVKLLGQGRLTKKLLVSKCQISASAREKIEKAGGKIE